MTRPPFLRLSDEVRDALDIGAPVLALESTLITHGMPFPRNLETARGAEAAARARGATPATIAVLDGQARVGLEPAVLEALARSGQGVIKAAAHDLGHVIAAGGTAGTTVSATLRLASLAGIQVFATGGIGGVHRGAATSFDVSADLHELARCPVALVSAGCKSVLDIPATLEVLETLGVPVIGYGTREFPAFFSRTSGATLTTSVDTPDEIARVYRTERALARPGGILVANPIPAEHELPAHEVQAWLDEALAAMATAGVTGKAVTPFLLQALVDRSGGRTLEANVRLIEHNAAVGAQIACALVKG
jgi:pseudouridylate synthase